MPKWPEGPLNNLQSIYGHNVILCGFSMLLFKKSNVNSDWPFLGPSYSQALLSALHKIYPMYSALISNNRQRNANESPNQFPYKVVNQGVTYLCPDSCAMVKARPSPVSSLMVQLRYLLHIPLMGANPMERSISSVSPKGTHTGIWSFLCPQNVLHV